MVASADRRESFGVDGGGGGGMFHHRKSVGGNNKTAGDNGKTSDVAVYTISVVGGYENQGFKQDDSHHHHHHHNHGHHRHSHNRHHQPADGGLAKPPPIMGDDDDSDDHLPKGKFKMSPKEKWRILKNVSTISLAFMVQFTAFQGTANLQSSINAHESLGTVSLSAIYAALVLSCTFVPTFLIKRLTVKWTLCLSMLCYIPYIGAQFYPRFYTLVPAGVLVGLGAAPMWAAKATYLTQTGAVYAKLTDQQVDGIVVRFFGFFFLAWQTAELWGNLISSLGKYGSIAFATGTGWVV